MGSKAKVPTPRLAQFSGFLPLRRESRRAGRGPDCRRGFPLDSGNWGRTMSPKVTVLSGYHLRFSVSVVLAATLTVCCRDKRDEPWSRFDPLVESVAESPTWTPDGSRVLYEDNGRIWSMDLKGNAMCVTEDWPYSAWSPDVSPDGHWLLFVSRADIFKARLNQDGKIDTSTVRALTDKGSNFFPRWSPDGKRIAYDSDVKGDSYGFYGVSFMDADGANKSRMPDTGGDGRAPCWSADGARVAYIGCVGHGAPEVLIADTNGANRRLLTNDTVWDDKPDWSPGGRRITIGRYPQPGAFAPPGIRVCIVDTGGGQVEVVTIGLDPEWSPDGTKLAFTADVEVDEGLLYTTIFVIDLGTRRKQQLVWR